MFSSENLVNERVDLACFEYLTSSRTFVQELEDYLASTSQTLPGDDLDRLALLTDAYAERIFDAEIRFTTVAMMELAFETRSDFLYAISQVGEAGRLITYWCAIRMRKLSVQRASVPTPHLDRLVRIADNFGKANFDWASFSVNTSTFQAFDPISCN
jgi:hypothetical protein